METRPSSNEDRPTKNKLDSSDQLQLRLQPGGMSDSEILEYFERNQNPEIQREKILDLRQEIISYQSETASTAINLHSWKDSKDEAEIRRLLRELEEARDLEKLIFGKTSRSDYKSNEQSNRIYNFKISMSAENQTRDSIPSNKTKQSSFVDIRNLNFVPRRESDPLIFDLGQDGIDTTGVQQGIKFDLNGDGLLEKTSFVQGNDYALALDLNQNGLIDSGNELFGDQNGSSDGIEELKKYDLNKDGIIDSDDEVFDNLRLINANRPSKSLHQAGIKSIDLERLKIAAYTNSGDRIEDGLNIKMKNGRTLKAYDVYFQFRE